MMIRKGRKKKRITVRQKRRLNHIHYNIFNRQEKRLETPKKEPLQKVLKKTSENVSKLNSNLNEQVSKINIKEKIESIKPIKKQDKMQDTKIKEERPKSSKKMIVFASIIWVVIAIGLIATIVGGKIAYDMLESKPEFQIADLKSPNSSIILDAEGNIVMELGMYLRENIEYEEMPNVLVDAFLAIEDSRYFSHFGFDIPRFSKAIIENLKSGSFAQGGSTITMQLIKNSYFQLDANADSTMAEREGMGGVQRKLQEIILAMEADQAISKQDQFALFVNKVNFGNNLRGVEKASQYYFGKSASELNLSESAFLAGLINSPNNQNPFNELLKTNPNSMYYESQIQFLENGTRRRNEVLDLMVYHGYISEIEAELAKSIKLEDQLVSVGNQWAQTNPVYQSYIDAVIDEVIDKTGEDPYYKPMIVHTNMDPHMQEYVYDIQNENTDIKFNNELCQTAIVIMDNQTGALIALGGGKDQGQSRSFNRATSAHLQPGSTVKPIFEYALAFEHLGWATTHTITDQPIWLYGSNHLIANAGGQGYTGDMTVEEAVARSLNTPAIQTLQAVIDEIDEEGCVEYLNAIGFDVKLEDFDLQYAIGGNKFLVTPVELGAAHAVLMNDGYYVEPHTVSYIEYYNGDAPYYADVEGTQVLSSGAAYMAATLEEYCVSGPFYNYMQVLRSDYPVYAKTGTTDWAKAGVPYGIPVGAARDSWLISQTSNYTTTIWMGFDKLEKGAYFTYSDDRNNLKGKIGKMILDELDAHFQYNPQAIERPDDVTRITHILGVYPYCYPTEGQSETGYIKKEYAELVDISTIEKEVRVGSLAGMGGSVQDDGSISIQWYGFGAMAEDGMTFDISATNYAGKTEFAYGRLYYPRYIFVNPSEYFANVMVDGSHVTTISSSSPSTTGWINYSPGQRVQVCGWTSDNPEQKCEYIR